MRAIFLSFILVLPLQLFAADGTGSENSPKFCALDLAGISVKRLNQVKPKQLRKIRGELFRLFYSHSKEIKAGKIPKPFRLVRIPTEEVNEVWEHVKNPGVGANLGRFPDAALLNAYVIVHRNFIIGHAIVFKEENKKPVIDLIGDPVENPLILDPSGASISFFMTDENHFDYLAEGMKMDLATFRKKIAKPAMARELRLNRSMGMILRASGR